MHRWSQSELLGSHLTKAARKAAVRRTKLEKNPMIFVTETGDGLYYPHNYLVFVVAVSGEQRLEFRKEFVVRTDSRR